MDNETVQALFFFFYNFCSVFRGVLSSMISELTRTAEGGIFSLMNDIDQIIIFYPILSPLALWGEDHIQGFRIRQSGIILLR